MSALLLAATLPFMQAWSDTGLISRDDDWAGVAAVVGYRGDGLTAAPGADPRSVLADGAGTPVDVNANEADAGAVGLAAGVTEFELPDPVVALQGSATAAAPHLVLSLDTRGRSGVVVRFRLRDVDGSGSNAAQAVALQYRVGASGEFAGVPGGYAADATTGPGAATLVTPVSAALPAAAENQPLVQLRVLTTNAVGQDEWVGVDDIEVEATGAVCGPGGPVPPGPVPPEPGPIAPSPGRPPSPDPPGPPAASPVTLSRLTLSPRRFSAAKQGAAVRRTGRAGASLRFRLSWSATVVFRVLGGRSSATPPARAPLVSREMGHFSIRGRRGINRLRFTGRLRGRPLPAGPYHMRAYAIDRHGVASAPADVRFRIR